MTPWDDDRHDASLTFPTETYTKIPMVTDTTYYVRLQVSFSSPAFTNVQNAPRPNAFIERSERCTVAVHGSSGSGHRLPSVPVPAPVPVQLYGLLACPFPHH